MKKLLLIFILLLMPIVLACGGDHDEITGAAVSDVCVGDMMGSGMMGFGYLWFIVLLYFIIGLGYVIYKLSKIEDKLRRRK